MRETCAKIGCNNKVKPGAFICEQHVSEIKTELQNPKIKEGDKMILACLAT